MQAGESQYQGSLKRVLTRLEEVTGRQARPEGGQYKTLCPAHPDRNPSLVVKWDQGSTAVYCHAGCTQGVGSRNDPTPVLEVLGLTIQDLFDSELEPTTRRPVVTNIHHKRKTERYEVAADRQPRTITKPDKGEVTGSPEITCWHLYQDPDTEEVTWACLRIVTPTDDGGYVKQFRYAHRVPDKRGSYLKVRCDHTDRDLRLPLPDGWAAGAHRDTTRRSLYRLSAVRAAVAAGAPVYLVEGESDADAATFAGVTASTNPMGGGKWLEQYSHELRGAHVVLVLDCDDEGIRHGETVAQALAGVAASIRVVQARAGKDVRDHLAAGYGLDDLVEVDLGIRALHPTSDDTNSTETETEPRVIDDPNTPNERPEYLVRHGELVERIWRTRGRGENAVKVATYKTVLGCVAWVDEISEEDHGEELLRYYRPTRDVTLHLERHDDSGAAVDQTEFRMPIDTLRKGEWIDEWPWPDTIISRRRSDKEKTLSALYQAIPAPRTRKPVYMTTGWRVTDTGAFFVHGGGAIGRGGTLDVDVELDPVLARTALPDPTSDPALLRQAYFEGTEPLRQLPAQIVAPLRGMTFRSMLGKMEMATNVAGVKNTAKTAISRLLIQHIAPGVRFSRGVKEMVSGAAHLSSSKGMARMLARAKDIPLMIDDLAPDRGGAAEARVRLGELARQVYNGSIQVKAHYEAGRVVTELGPRCSLLTTGEVLAEGSGGSRCFNIHVEPGMIEPDQIADLETKDRVDARALLGSSFLMWVAGRYQDLLTWTEELSPAFLAAWSTSLRDVPGDRSRLAEAARDYSLGELVLLRFLNDTGALTDDEVDQCWQWSLQGIRAAARTSHTDTTDPARNLLGYVKDALWTGKAHLTDRKGGVPDLPGDPDAPARYGWSPQQRTLALGTPAADPVTTWSAGGTKVGAIDGDRVLLLPSEAEHIGRTQAQKVERPWTETTVSLSAALDANGWLATHTDARTGRRHRSVGRSLYGGITRVWDLPRTLIDDVLDPDDTSEPTESVPLDPRLTRAPGWGEIPLAPSTTPDQPDQIELPMAVGSDTSPSASPEEPPTLRVLPRTDDPEPEAPPPAPLPQEASMPAPTSARARSPRPVETYKIAVMDVDAVYVMEPDGEVVCLPTPEPLRADDLGNWGDGLGLRHGTAGLGQIWLTPRLSDHLGLRPPADADMATKITELGLDKTTFDRHAQENRALWAMLTESSRAFQDQLAADGWWIHRDSSDEVVIKPHVTIEKEGRAFELVLAAYVERWDAQRGPATLADYPLPDPDEHPADYARELTRRVARLAAGLAVPWQQTPAATGAKLADSLTVHKATDWRTLGANPFPALTRLGGQRELEPAPRWSRIPSHAELDQASRLWLFDGRTAFLTRGGSMDLGIGEPTHLIGEDAHALLGQKKTPFGAFLVSLPIWDYASLPEPHPEMSTEQVNQRWVMNPTVRLFSEVAHKYTQFDLSALEIHEAWIWPETTRALGEWVNSRVGPALQHARAAAVTARQGGDPTDAASWDAVAACLKGVYTGYFGKMASPDSLRAPERYRHHHQPVWYEAIKGEARVQDWLKLARHGHARSIYPIAAAGTDSYYYLGGEDPSEIQPQVDDGKLGKLRVKDSLVLDDTARELLAQGIPAPRLASELARRRKERS